MNKTIAVLAVAALMAAAVHPALAHCGGSHGKSRAAQTAKKPTTAKGTQPKNDTAPAAPATTTSGSDAMPGSVELSDPSSST